MWSFELFPVIWTIVVGYLEDGFALAFAKLLLIDLIGENMYLSMILTWYNAEKHKKLTIFALYDAIVFS